MASSYTTNSGIQKPAQGDQTGEWGTTINTNMDIIDRSINGVLALTLTGTTTTVATTDGTLTDGMYKVLVLGGSPSGTNTITITPNDADKLYFVVNSSGQTATFTQGSGANVNVLNGDTAVIYCDGAGSGAAVADFTKDLGMSSVNIDGGSIDGTAIGGTTPAAGAFTTVAASGTLTGGTTIAVGYEAAASGTNSQAFGYSALASGTSSTAIGYDMTSSGNHTIALGYQGTVSGVHSTLLQLDTTNRTLSQANAFSIMGGNVGIGTLAPDTALSVAGEVSMTTLDIGGTNVTATAAELNYLDITTLGTSEASKAVTVDSSGDLLVPDSDKFKFGAGSDMQVYHDGTNSYITNATGELKLATESSGIAIAIGHSTSEVTFGDNVTVTGNFDVNGTTTTIDTTNLTVTDPLVKFGQAYTGSAYDEGFIVTRGDGSSSNTANKGLIWDESADEFAAIACNTEDGTTAGNVTINSYADLQVGKLTGSSLDISADVDIDGTTNLDVVDIDGAVDMAGTLVVTGVTTHGGNVVSDTDSTDDLGTTSVRWANLFVDGITATDQITATGFTGTLDGILGSGTAAAATVTTLDTSGVVNLNLTTDSSSSTSGALIIDGGVGIAKKLYVGTDFDVSGNAVIDGTALTTGVHTFTATPVFSADVTIEDDLFLDSDGAVIHLGEDNEITLTHSADSGLILGRTSTADDAFSIFTISTGDNDIAAGDKLGQINWSAPNEGAGTDAIATAASIFVASEGDFSASNNATTMYFSTSTSGQPTERLKITSGGNVVFPTDGMALQFGAHPADTSLTHVADVGLLCNGSLQASGLLIANGGTIGSASNANTLTISAAAADDPHVTVDGISQINAPAGTGAGVWALQVNNAKTDNGTASNVMRVRLSAISPGDSNHMFQCVDGGGTVRFFVQNNGTTGGTSDRTLKENIVDATDKLAELRQLQVRNYNWIDHGPEGGFKELGFIAQEVEAVFPKMVRENPETGKKMLLDDVFVPILVKSLQEAADKIDALETRIAALEA